MSMLSGIDFRMQFLRMDDDLKPLLLQARPVIEKNIDTVLDEFYGFVMQYPELEALFTSPGLLEHARDAQKRHWLDNIFSGNFGTDYMRSAYTIAKAHERIALKPEFYLGAYEMVMERVLELLDQTFSPSLFSILKGQKKAQLKKLSDIRNAVLKAIILDIGLVVDVYFAEVQKTSARVLNDLAVQFEESVGDVVSSVSSSASEMKSISNSMASAASQSSDQATLVANAADQASENVQTVAAAAEELSSSIGEIGRQVTDSARVAREAVEQAEHTNHTVSSLSNSVARITEILDLINGIAEQTNLLALNATIESARAGEAGKGFAVVAGEVKNLAQQTGRATDEISVQINDVKTATQNAVEEIQAVCKTITMMDDISSAIAAAVEEQNAATAEISRNVQEAASGTQEVTDSISGVSEAAGQTGEAAEKVLNSADNLSNRSNQLTDQVSNFLSTMRKQNNTVEDVAVSG